MHSETVKQNICSNCNCSFTTDKNVAQSCLVLLHTLFMDLFLPLVFFF